MRVMVTTRSPEGVVFVPFHFVEAAANVLTNDRLDPKAKIPDFKVCAVRLTPIAAPAGRDPATDQPLTERGAIKDQALLVH
jgi:predicted molibdopterin-dependent oxidoreductase YjgC